MIAVFGVLFGVGLIAAVRVMLYGVERQRVAGDDGPRSFSVSPAVVVSLAGVTGVVGSVLTKLHVSPTVTWIAAISAGLLATLISVRSVARWWRIVPEHDVDDERYVLQGSIGSVVNDIDANGTGTISLGADATNRLMPAREIDAQAVPKGTEVVIERIENGVAYVEAWAAVEKRL